MAAPDIPFPYTVNYFTPNEEKLYGRSFAGLIKIGTKNYVNFERYKDQASIFYNFKIRPDDVWLFGHPRSGTTLMQEILWIIGNDFDYERAAKYVMDVRFPFLESSILRNETDRDEYLQKNKGTQVSDDLITQITSSPYKYLTETKERRFIKTHQPFSFMNPNLLNSGCKVVYMARNPKDVIVSNYYYPSMGNKECTFEEFWNSFKHGFNIFGPYFSGLKEGWERRNHKNVLFMFYENVVKDKQKTIIDVANFLGKKITSSEVETLEKHLDIKNFKNNKSVNNDHLVDLGLFKKNSTHSFIRKGKPGSWKEHFTGKLAIEVDEWIAKNLEGTDLVFPEV